MQSKQEARRVLPPDGAASQNRVPLDEAARVHLRDRVHTRYGTCPVGALIANQHAVRTHSKWQVKKNGRAMQAAGPLAPLVIDDTHMVLAGHGRLAAAKELGDEVVPVVQVFGISEAQKTRLKSPVPSTYLRLAVASYIGGIVQAS